MHPLSASQQILATISALISTLYGMCGVFLSDDSHLQAYSTSYSGSHRPYRRSICTDTCAEHGGQADYLSIVAILTYARLVLPQCDSREISGTPDSY
ncbi:hypothetical protein DEU56DRAFT_783834, partial [Suillus clintonianus]|uniref:uncharacterized protein n=1 Tax=Suillus clintonianus TaxID=1904413 RepID=UPI001B87EDBE